MWGIVPAAGRGSRIQPLAFSKELLPVGSRLDKAARAALRGQRIPRRAHDPRRRRQDLLRHLARQVRHHGLLRRRLRRGAAIAYVVQPQAERAVRRHLPRDAADRGRRAGDRRPARHDLVPGERALRAARRRAVLPALPGRAPRVLRRRGPRRSRTGCWRSRSSSKTPPRTGSGARSRCRAAACTSSSACGASVCAGTSISARSSTPISPPAARPLGVKAGDAYVDVGTLHGYRAAISLLSRRGAGRGRLGGARRARLARGARARRIARRKQGVTRWMRSRR